MTVLDLLLGRPLASDEARAECVGPAAGIPIFGLDALSSAAYGPEAALTLLIPLGAAGIAYMVPISASIIVLLTIVYFSYRQTIQAYPGGGGSYTVARQNLGVSAGLLAAAALMIDYILVVAVGISAGVGALVSAVPSLQPHTLALCLGILVLITLINLRGVRETGLIFMAPTYLFVGSLFVAIAIGVFKTFMAGGHPLPVEPLPRIAVATAAWSGWLILQAFASGCTAMTGVEAVSNGVKAFREPVIPTARRILTIIIALLIALLAGIAYLVRAYGIQATDPGLPGYQSVLSMLLAAVTGRSLFYYVSIGSILVVLALDWLADALLTLAERPPLEGNWYDSGSRLRVWMPPVRLERLAKLAFDQIRQASATTPAVLICQLDAIRRLAPRLPDACRQVLSDQADAILEIASALVVLDRRDVEAASHRAHAVLEALSPPSTGEQRDASA